jgi:hypothetical protein
MEQKHHKSWKEMSLGLKILAITGGIIFFAGVLVLAGFVIMWLWNWLMPKLFSLPLIGYWEAWGILILSHILFGKKGFGRHIAERSRKHKLHERLAGLHSKETPEGEGAGA